jgi:hypothetical protein
MRRWAWEFLRRNDAFIAACDEIAALPGESDRKAAQRAVAAKFGLNRFKPYTQEYADDKPPKFTVSGIYVYANTSQDEPKEVPLTALKKGEVVVQFNLMPSVEDERAMLAQLKQARVELRAMRRKLMKVLPAPVSVVRSAGQARLYIRHICVLDLIRSEGAVTAALRVLRADEETLGYLLREDGGNALVAMARKFAEEQYLAVALAGVKLPRKVAKASKNEAAA